MESYGRQPSSVEDGTLNENVLGGSFPGSSSPG